MSHGHSAPMSFTRMNLILAATFVFGFICGGLIFLVVHTGDDSVSEAKKEKVKGISVTAESYGGCTSIGTCPSYIINQKGDYTFTQKSAAGDKVSEDELTTKQFDELTTLVRETDLALLQKTSATTECAAIRGGASERYTISVDSEEFLFDSCTQELSRSELFSTLRDYFIVFTALHRM